MAKTDNVFTRAKAYQRKHPRTDWQTCIQKVSRKKRRVGSSGNDSSRGAGHTSTATKAYTSGNRTATKTITAHVKIGRRAKKKTSYRQTGSSNRKADSDRKARKPGMRKSRAGNVYYERRKNRSDVPGKVTGTGMTTGQLLSAARSQLTEKLDRAVVRKYHAKLKRDKKKIQKIITETKTQIRRLS